jgi:hypothetical protein
MFCSGILGTRYWMFGCDNADSNDRFKLWTNTSFSTVAPASPSLTVDTSNRVCINTPAAFSTVDWLTVYGTTATYINIGSSAADTNIRGIKFSNAAAAVTGILAHIPNTAGTDSLVTMFVGGGSSTDRHFNLDDDGRLGIGTGATAMVARATFTGNLTQTAANWGLNGVGVRFSAATYTDSSTAAAGTATNAVCHALLRPTFAASNTTVTMTNAATLYVANAPLAGTNTTLTNSYALWIDDGISRFDGNILANGGITMADGQDIVLNTTTGTKFGTAVGQKLSLYGVTPVIQRASAAQAAVATTAATQTTPWGFSTQAQADGIITLINELRAALVALGPIKGSA